MRWPIRNQILLPFLSIQIVAIAAVAAASSLTAMRQVEAEIAARLESVKEVLRNSSFPLTLAVLEQLNELTGAEFIRISPDGVITSSTIPLTSDHLPDLQSPPITDDPAPRDLRSWILVFDDTRYFAGIIETPRAGTVGHTLILYPEQRWVTARREALLPPLAIGTFLVLLIVIASILVARRIGRRIQQVERQVTAVAGGDFTPVPLIETNDELRDLGQSLNRMAELLSDLMHQARESERALLLAQIVGGLSHQLRNALTGARLAVQLHQRRCPRTDDESLHVALRQLTLTEQQIRSLLRVSRGARQQDHPGDLAAILRDVVLLVAPVCEHRKVELSPPADPITRPVDHADAWQAALLNLLLNAIEAAGPGGRVRISCTTTDGQTIIEIADNGPGIAGEVKDRLFDPFVTTKPEGVGLGLALARQTAEESGAQLTVARQDGETIFRIAIPPGRAATEGSLPVT